MAKTILLTGVAGFIGSHLAESLLKKGHRVIGVDNFISGQRSNLHILGNYKSFIFIKKRVEDLKREDLNEKIEIIAHLASPASPLDFTKIPEEIVSVNTVGTLNLLRLANYFQARFLYTSTSEVYGDPLVHPQSEDYWGNVNPQGSRSVYDESKRLGETYVALFRRRDKLDTRIVRIFNTYGPRMRLDDGRVITNFIKAILENKPLPIYGNGQQTRSFCYVSDLVGGLEKMLFSDNLAGQTINLGNNQEISINELVKVFEMVVKKQLEVYYQPLPHNDDPRRRCPDLTKAKLFLDYQPQVSLKKGLSLTFDYFSRNYHENK